MAPMNVGTTGKINILIVARTKKLRGNRGRHVGAGMEGRS
jgi:hypothetical protein